MAFGYMLHLKEECDGCGECVMHRARREEDVEDVLLDRPKRGMRREAVRALLNEQEIGEGMALFCVSYYVRGERFDGARRIAGRSAKQCRRYVKEVEEAQKSGA